MIDTHARLHVRDENRRLSKLLWDARETTSMLNDILESHVGRRDDVLTKQVQDIDTYRYEQGWNPFGFGGES